MLTPEIYAAMTGSVILHSKSHLEAALALCDKIAKGDAEYKTRLKEASDLILELKVVRSDMDRALLFLGIDAFDSGMDVKSEEV